MGDTRVVVADLPLGTGRAPWLQNVDKRLRAEKESSGGRERIPQLELDELRASWLTDGGRSPAEQRLCESEVTAARARPRNIAQARELNSPLQIPEPAGTSVIGPLASAVEWEARTLWGHWHP